MKIQTLTFLSLLSVGSAAPIGDVARAIFGRNNCIFVRCEDGPSSIGGVPTFFPTGTSIPFPTGTQPTGQTGEVTATNPPRQHNVRHLLVNYHLAPTSAPPAGASLSPEDYLKAIDRNEIKHRRRQFGPTGAPSAPSFPTPTNGGGFPGFPTDWPSLPFPSIPMPTGGFPGFPSDLPTELPSDLPFPFPTPSGTEGGFPGLPTETPSEIPTEVPAPSAPVPSGTEPSAPEQSPSLPAFSLATTLETVATPAPTSGGEEEPKNPSGRLAKRAAEWMHVGEGKQEKENLMRWVKK